MPLPSALNANPVHGASMVSPSVNLEGANPNVAVSATMDTGFQAWVDQRGSDL